MFYLIRGVNQRTIAETPERAAALVARGWQVTNRRYYMYRWTIDDMVRLHELTEAARDKSLIEQMVGGHIV